MTVPTEVHWSKENLHFFQKITQIQTNTEDIWGDLASLQSIRAWRSAVAPAVSCSLLVLAVLSCQALSDTCRPIRVLDSCSYAVKKTAPSGVCLCAQECAGLCTELLGFTRLIVKGFYKRKSFILVSLINKDSTGRSRLHKESHWKPESSVKTLNAVKVVYFI